MPRLVAWLVVLTLAAPAIAGTKFRLEIGPPIAAGTGTPVIKQFKNTVVLVVRPRVCDTPSSVQMTGTAEGLVNGVRQSLRWSSSRSARPRASRGPATVAERTLGAAAEWNLSETQGVGEHAGADERRHVRPREDESPHRTCDASKQVEALLKEWS